MFQRVYPFRNWRWQFSLRALLLAMALIGGGLTIYRWPWEEKLDSGPLDGNRFVGTIQYRRGWTGKPLRHGVLKVTYLNSGISIERAFYDDVVQRERIFEASGKLRGDTWYQDGEPHGPYFSEYAGMRHVGTHRFGKMHGHWQSVYEDEKYTLDGEYRAGQRHGRWTWTSPTGRVLQSAGYEQGRLVAWNDEPVAEELRRWIGVNIPDAETRHNLLEIEPPPDEQEVQSLSYGEKLYFVGKASRPVVFHWRWGLVAHYPQWDGRPFAEGLLQDTLQLSCTFAVRNGMLHVIRLNEAELDWQDRSGVSKIAFAAESDQAKQWLGPAVAQGFYNDHPLALLRELFDPDVGSCIELDTTAVDDLEPPYNGPLGNLLLPPPRPLRDIVGQHLNRGGYYCEQRSNTLVIKPHADRKAK